MSSITSRLSWACWRARSRLSRAVRSSCASRIDSSPDSSATTNSPMPLRPACDISAAESGTEPATRPAAASSISATPAAVASAGRRGVRMPAISTGSTSSAAKFRLDVGSIQWIAPKTSRSTPIVIHHCQRADCSARSTRSWSVSHQTKACTT